MLHTAFACHAHHIICCRSELNFSTSFSVPYKRMRRAAEASPPPHLLMIHWGGTNLQFQSNSSSSSSSIQHRMRIFAWKKSAAQIINCQLSEHCNGYIVTSGILSSALLHQEPQRDTNPNRHALCFEVLLDTIPSLILICCGFAVILLPSLRFFFKPLHAMQ